MNLVNVGLAVLGFFGLKSLFSDNEKSADDALGKRQKEIDETSKEKSETKKPLRDESGRFLPRGGQNDSDD